ncbi:class IIb bacteriocin, lactobin A/cerein 7B family [Paraferrimonas sp. SM1919]|uniref:class IIb bacteriocin, lactobin A/cerein 7B family n=1 Tax=Paraferrimonas sp. SM1919 TaxID=2662263 RepID=UPI0013D13D43|nr:class IIb bacteriocin, lactobin A/cerein 7B family [Paraferrimonas sp. SM1919]
MRELNLNEIEEVNGGIVPIIGFGIALASHVGVGGAATTLTAHFLSGAGLALATYGLAEFLSDK